MQTPDITISIPAHMVWQMRFSKLLGDSEDAWHVLELARSPRQPKVRGSAAETADERRDRIARLKAQHQAAQAALLAFLCSHPVPDGVKMQEVG